MIDERELFDRAVRRWAPPEPSFDRLVRRRDRKRRNQRIVAGAVGLAIAIAALLAGLSLSRSTERPDRPLPRPQPSPRQQSSLLRRDDVLILSGDTLFAVDTESGDRRALAACSKPCYFIQVPAWSPDGRWVAYDILTCPIHLACDQLHASPITGIWVRGAVGPPRQLVSECPSLETCYPRDFAWSPDGTKLAYALPLNAGSAIETIEPDGSHRTRLAQSASTLYAPTWSPDGTQIAYTLSDASSSRVYVMNADGSHQTALAGSIGVATFAWSPNGKELVLDTLGNDFSRIYVVNADGSQLRLLAEGTSFEGPGLPVWSPDGTRIAYVRTPGTTNDYGAEYWVMNADGSHQIRLYQSPCDYQSAAACDPYFDALVWSPDGSKIALTTGPGSWFVTGPAGGGTLTPINELIVIDWRGGS